MTEPATDPDQVEEEAEQPRSSLVGVWATILVLVAALAYVFLFDLLTLGDGAVGAQSETLAMGQEPASDGNLVDVRHVLAAWTDRIRAWILCNSMPFGQCGSRGIA